jgi:hypothetical protein
MVMGRWRTDPTTRDQLEAEAETFARRAVLV